MVEVGKIGDKTLVLDGRYISIFRGGKFVWKKAYMAYILPDGNLYMYRRRVRITELSGNTLTDYQVKIEIGAGDPIFAHARSAGEDIRFCYYPEEEMLSYWIEKFDPDAEEAIIWVKVPEIPANSEIEIYMYYGNPDVASASDGEATFEFFDDFEGTDLDPDKWSELAAGGSYSVSDSILTVQGGAGAWEEIGAKQQFSPPHIYEHYLKSAEQLCEALGVDDRSATGSCIGSCVDLARSNAPDKWEADREGSFTSVTRTVSFSDKFHVVSFYVSDAKVEYYVDYVKDAEITTNVPKDPLGFFEGCKDNGTAWIDWVRVRKYAPVEPSVSVGAEE